MYSVSINPISSLNMSRLDREIRAAGLLKLLGLSNRDGLTTADFSEPLSSEEGTILSNIVAQHIGGQDVFDHGDLYEGLFSRSASVGLSNSFITYLSSGPILADQGKYLVELSFSASTGEDDATVDVELRRNNAQSEIVVAWCSASTRNISTIGTASTRAVLTLLTPSQLVLTLYARRTKGASRIHSAMITVKELGEQASHG